MGRSLGEQRLVALFAGGCLLFNFPLLALWDREVFIFGVPLFPAALFLIWLMLIAALGWIIEHCDDAALPDAARRLSDASKGSAPPPTD